jgi:hypothetical protein
MDGILLDEEKAIAAANLRIAYDEVYRLAESNHKYMVSVIQIQEQELQRGDEMLKQKNAELRRLRDSWWQRNKLSVGISIGLVVGVGVALGAGAVWAEVEENKVP